MSRAQDTDADGTLSARELRQALNKVRKKNPDMPGMDEMLAALDGDGDGILTLPEFIEKMPKALTQAIKSLGPMTLVNGAASMGKDTHRERERKVAADVQAAKQASRGAHDVALHTAALKAGQKVRPSPHNTHTHTPLNPTRTRTKRATHVRVPAGVGGGSLPKVRRGQLRFDREGRAAQDAGADP